MYLDLSLAATMLSMLGMVLAFAWWLLNKIILEPQKAMMENLEEAVAELKKLAEKNQDFYNRLDARVTSLETAKESLGKEAESFKGALARVHQRIDEVAGRRDNV